MNRAFQYDLISEKWVECTDENFINDDIEKIPCVLIVHYFNFEFDVYCPKHHNIEGIFYSVDAGDSELISDEGCKFQESDRLRDKKLLYCPIHKQLEEIILTDGNVVITDAFCKFTGLTGVADYPQYKVPFRWRIFQSSNKNFVNIAADIARLRNKSFNFLRHWDNFYISISANGSSLTNYLQVGGADIPDIVIDAAMETLRDSTKAIYGIKPTVITKFQGLSKLFAYIAHPFDINITLLRNFFADFGSFSKIFPHDSTDNYKIICQLLEIKPPKSLRKAYTKNPYAIIWYMIFKQFGVKDVNYMQKFFLIDDCITVMPLDEFRFMVKTKQVVKMKYSDRWRAFEHYCKCLIKARGEKVFMNWLYKFSTKENLNQNQIDTFEMFYKYEENISAELKAKLFKNGLTWYIHDAISAEVSDYLQERDNVKIFYDDKVLNCEGNINGYKFEVVKETKTLYQVGLELANCVATYKNEVLDLISIIFIVIKEGDLVACIEISEGEIIQARGYHNQDLSYEISEAVKDWQNLKNIIQMKDATAEFFQNEVKTKVSAQKEEIVVRIARNDRDMITQAEIDALLAGARIIYE